MKKYILLFAIMLFSISTIEAANFVQEEVFNFTDYVKTFAAFVGSILPLTGWIKGWVKIEDNAAKSLSWIVGFVVAYAAWFLKLGIFETYTSWWQVALVALLGSFAANGVFKTVVAQAFLGLIKAK